MRVSRVERDWRVEGLIWGILERRDCWCVSIRVDCLETRSKRLVMDLESWLRRLWRSSNWDWELVRVEGGVVVSRGMLSGRVCRVCCCETGGGKVEGVVGERANLKISKESGGSAEEAVRPKL